VLEGELRAVDPDDPQTGVTVRAIPRLEMGEGAQAVDAGVRPEVDEDDLAAIGGD
jgi:hypothetical protein